MIRPACVSSSTKLTTTRFVERFKHAQLAKQRAASPPRCMAHVGVRVDPHALFDVHIKRIHEYKRQLLNILYDDRAIQSHPRPSARRARTAREDLCRKGGGMLRACQADHQAGTTMSPASSIDDPVVGDRLKVVFAPELRRHRLPKRSSPPPTCPSRFRPPAWRHPAPAT